MDLLATRDTWWTAQCEALLSAEGITARWAVSHERSGVTLLDVPTSEAAHAAEILSEMLGEELAARRARFALGEVSSTPLLLQPAFAAALCLGGLFLVIFWLTGPTAAGGPHFARGALWMGEGVPAEWWRLVTAATLHADVEHALGNAAFVTVLGWASAERMGAGMMLATWLVTAVAGFGAALVFSDPGVTVGASGGVFGLLGAAAAHAGRYRHVDLGLGWRHRLAGVAAAVLLLAFTAFSPQANIPAHVGGFVAGLALGAVLPAVALGARWQLLAAAGWVVMVAGGWWLAWSMV